MPDGHARQGVYGIGFVLSLLGLLPGSSARKATVGCWFRARRGCFLGRRQFDATNQRFAVAFNDGEKEGFMDVGVKGKRWDGELDDVSDLTLLFGTSA